MVACENCFFGGAKVGTKGNIKSPFVIVGESPGIMELAKGQPFIGDSGKLLDECLKPYVDLLSEFDCMPFVTNAIQCMPRQKDPGRLGKACCACHPRLVDELKQYPRRVILALGNAAMWSLTGNYGLKITQERGKIFKVPYASDGLVVTVHPAFLLRGGGNLNQFKRDIDVAIRRLKLTEDSLRIQVVVSQGERERTLTGGMKQNIVVSGQFIASDYCVLETSQEVRELADEINDSIKVVGADTETAGFNSREDEILCAGISIGRDRTIVIPGELMSAESNILFQNKKVRWCWHNGKFDVPFYRQAGMPDARVDDDTMLMSYVLNEKGGLHDLEQVGSDWLMAPNYKDMLERYLPNRKTSYRVIPKDVLYKYQAIDANLTFWLRDILYAKVSECLKSLGVYEKILIPASEFLMGMEKEGFWVDMQRVRHNIKRLEAECSRLEKEFERVAAKHGHAGINIRSPLQVAPYLYDTLGLRIGNKKPTSTDADTLEMLPRHEAVLPLKEYRKIHKQLSTFVLTIEDRLGSDGRMHSTFKLHVTPTGRLASNKPNMQNQPREPEIRMQFGAPPGRVLLDNDLGQAELRVLACKSGDKEMLRIFRAGISLHDEVATYLFGAKFNKEQKMIAKNINFGIIYGVSAYGLMDQIEIGAKRLGSAIHVTVQQCQQWIDGWFDRFPEAKIFLDRCASAPVRGTALVTAFGRKRRFGIIGKESLKDQQNQAMNFPEQSAAHDITLLSGIELQPIIKERFDGIIVNEVHDCLLTELPDDMGLVLPCAKLVMDTMIRIPRDWGLTAIPFVSEAEVGNRWGGTTKLTKEAFKIDPITVKGMTHEEFFSTYASCISH